MSTLRRDMCNAACKFLERAASRCRLQAVERIEEPCGLCGIFCDNVAARYARADCSTAKNGFAVRLFLGFIKLQFQWGSDMTRSELAKQYFTEGYNCAQSVVLAFADKVNVDTETIKAFSAPFGGGMGRLREVCGAVSGMVMVAGLSRKWDTLDRTSKNDLYALERKLAEEFRARVGDIVCRELIKSRPHGDVHNSLKPGCKELVGIAAEIVEQNVDFE